MSHASYLINLGSPKKEGLEKSVKAFAEEIERCHLLKLSYLNFHPGSALDKPVEQCLETIANSLLSLEKLIHKGATRLLLETTAGQGSNVGATFEELDYIIQRVEKHIPIGVCIDTCHIFAAGYDIRGKQQWKETLKLFDEQIGLKHLYAIHVNDSKFPLNSRKDRHACLGKGEIGEEGFKAMMTNPHLKELPKYLETPDPYRWPEEIELLRSYAKG